MYKKREDIKETFEKEVKCSDHLNNTKDDYIEWLEKEILAGEELNNMYIKALKKELAE